MTVKMTDFVFFFFFFYDYQNEFLTKLNIFIIDIYNSFDVNIGRYSLLVIHDSKIFEIAEESKRVRVA